MKRKYQNNIYEFPNSENRELMEQKKRLAKIIVKIEQKDAATLLRCTQL